MRRSQAERREFVETRAEQMKANPTTAEARMWELLEPLQFRRQCVLEGFTKNWGKWTYILDFYHPDLKLCVEVDGPIHRKKQGRDRRRDARLKAEGIVTLRVENKAVLMYPKVTEDFIRRNMIMARVGNESKRRSGANVGSTDKP